MFLRKTLACCLLNQENGTKKSQKISADFLFLQFPFMATLSHWNQDWVKAGPSIFRNMLKCQKHEACKVWAQSPEPEQRSRARQRRT